MSVILSYDGKGINDCRDPYKPRVATFTGPEEAEEFGKLFAAAPRMAQALKSLFDLGILDNDKRNSEYANDELAEARAALAMVQS